jgi:hypothetical protein
MANEEAKKVAAKALRVAGRSALVPLNMRMNSSSPRQWVGDRSWWMINVEFQASSWSVSSYLNVGLQDLWTVVDYRFFAYGYRVDIPGYGQSARLDGDPDDATRAADVIATAAGAEVIRWDNLLSADRSHLLWLTQQHTLKDDMNAGIAYGRLGDSKSAQSRLLRDIDSYADDIPWQIEKRKDRIFLADLVRNLDDFNMEVDTRIAATRALLKLDRANRSRALRPQ